MKVGVFGDSFADPGKDLNSVDKRDIGLSWVEILSKEFEVTCFAEGASSFYFSYKKILENVDKFDYIVLCVTDYWRLTLSNTFINPISNSGVLHVSGINGVNYINAQIRDSKKLFQTEKQILSKIADSIKNYFLYWRQDDEVQAFHNLMLGHLEKTIDKIILVPCFKNSYGDNDPNNSVISLFDISNNELRSKGFFEKFPKAFSDTPPLKEFDGRMLTDYRKCHFSQENNLILANIISDSIKNSFTGRLELDKDLFVVPNKPLEFYLGLANGSNTIGYPIHETD